ncbi:flagellar basal body protein [Sphingomonas abaci]|uniref:Flagellar basal-body rod protein FlgB n=1 Tax=Sphingomonas abaci TaxID=237611 RepID=A0A7W7AGM1_9SPHN|nr:flagellar basal body protein [Sphingomonas abaci]MBB4616678.1 flagellar basal-body rod protein FlgB [Sphingomonas abaci]
MADGIPPILSGIAREMRHLAERQKVVAQNIANSETAGYKAQDVVAPDFSSLLDVHSGPATIARPQVALTAGMSALGARPLRGSGSVIIDHDVSETKPDGNNVTLEDQLLKMGRIQSDFAAMTSLYRKQQGLLRTAIGKSGG